MWSSAVGQRTLLEVPADDGHGVDRCDRRHAKAAERRDQSAPCRIGQRQVVDRRGEDVGDLLRDELLRRGHADVERLREPADRIGGLLAERRVRLVADHELVGGTRELVGVPREPGVRLDRHRIAPQRLAVLLDRVGEAIPVALRRQVASELVDEQAAMGEDQHAELSRGLDEAGCGDRLARGGRVAEAIAPDRAGVGRREAPLVLRLLVDELDVLRVLLVVLELVHELRDAAVPDAVLVGAPLGRRDELREHPGERIDLVPPERRSRRGPGRLRGEHALEPEHQPVPDLPVAGRTREPLVHLGLRVVERAPARGAGGKRDLRVLTRGGGTARRTRPRHAWRPRQARMRARPGRSR